MAKYVSIIERRVATTKGVTLCFQPMVPLEVHPVIEEDVIAAGLVREDIFNAAMKGDLTAVQAASVGASVGQQTLEAGISADEPAPVKPETDEDAFDRVVEEMKAAKAEDAERAAAIAEMEARADAEAEASEKSPVFDQAVFEAGVREIIAKNDPASLTPKGAPKASVLADLVGFEVKSIQITNFLRNLE